MKSIHSMTKHVALSGTSDPLFSQGTVIMLSLFWHMNRLAMHLTSDVVRQVLAVVDGQARRNDS